MYPRFLASSSPFPSPPVDLHIFLIYAVPTIAHFAKNSRLAILHYDDGLFCRSKAIFF